MTRIEKEMERKLTIRCFDFKAFRLMIKVRKGNNKDPMKL